MSLSYCSSSSLFYPNQRNSTEPCRRRITVAMCVRKGQPITLLTKLLWGKSLPPGILISTVRFSWNTLWHLMMSQMAPSDSKGAYSRPPSKFRLQSPFPLVSPSSLHLYVGIPCPWAHRALIVRALKGLEHAIPISVARPGKDGAWEFLDGKVESNQVITPTRDMVNGYRTLREVYRSRTGGYDGRATVPMLWDSARKEVVCNESYDIIEFFNSGLNDVARNPDLDLAPLEKKEEINKWIEMIYSSVNNGVYRVGFAQSQQAYDEAVKDLFGTLDRVESQLGTSRFLCGDQITLADVCLFTTLIRFDIVYNVLFKCTRKKVAEYPNMYGYLREIYQMPEVAGTCNLAATMDGYFGELFPLNPGCIRPVLPVGYETDALLSPHNRQLIGKSL